MDNQNLKSAVEAVLFASGTPVEVDRLAVALNIPLEKAGAVCAELAEDYKNRGGGILVVRLGDSYRMCSDKQHADVIRTVMDIKRNTPLSQAASEVLAVIAYNQPVTKAFVEQVRGVDCSVRKRAGLSFRAGRLCTVRPSIFFCASEYRLSTSCRLYRRMRKTVKQTRLRLKLLNLKENSRDGAVYNPRHISFYSAAVADSRSYQYRIRRGSADRCKIPFYKI